MYRNFDKCERCRKCPATIECQECGTSQRSLKMCYDCDKSYHKMFEKEQQHHRGPVKFDTAPAPIKQGSPLRRKFNDAQSLSPLRSNKTEVEDLLEQREIAKQSYQTNQTLQSSNNVFSQENVLSPTLSRFNDDDRGHNQDERKQSRLQQSYLSKASLLKSPNQENMYSQLGGNETLKNTLKVNVHNYNDNQNMARSVLSPSHTVINEVNDLAQYYQKMAEEYRQKYLDLEREFNSYKVQKEHEIYRTREDTDHRVSQKFKQEIDEISRRSSEQIQQRDIQINLLRQQSSELESRIQQECEQMVILQRLQSNLEVDYKESFKGFESQLKEKDEKYERLIREHEYQLSKFQRHHEQEKENLKRDYEALIKHIKDEYQTCNNEMKTLLEAKNTEISQLQIRLSESQDVYRKERNEFEDTINKDKYTTELFSMENEKLRLAKQDFEKEREHLMTKIQYLEIELQRDNLEKKETKKKAKKLERIVYGKK
ncbi:UNKNOWN [Stylonychia lemnae]|uniref:Uncharacterized protein n=1 Tax=Stylonychia lemnae TaxID=5949 RepID=A0A078A4L5_STYLE|nr:UNKNOWN [Stylonychia lemnae]|eukprot:CDW75704.1 UNKNOWN [Stylonychia lemnae]